MDNIHDAAGILVMLTDKVSDETLSQGSDAPTYVYRLEYSVLFCLAGSSLKVVSTMSVGYGERVLT
jgi:hypothetical protein